MARSPAMAPTTLGGGATTYDVSPPAATTAATASGVALSAKTFSAFTGTDAGSIDGYTARTVNAAGSTSWSGSGLGAYTPSGGADGDAGVLALDATIGGVVVATALHDYSRAAAGGGFGWNVVEEIDLTDGNVTTGSATTPGAFTIYESDGTTVRATGTFLSPGGATGTISWDSSGVRVQCTGGTGAIYAVFDAPMGSLTDEEEKWHLDVVATYATVPSGDISLITLGNNSNPGSGTSVGIDVQNTGGTYDIEIRRTSSGVTYGLQELPGALPSTLSGRFESRGGDSCWVWWDSSATDYLADGQTDKTGGGKAHGAPGVIDSNSLWNGSAWYAIGGTAGTDATLKKWRTRELS